MTGNERGPLHDTGVQSAPRHGRRDTDPTTAVESERARFALTWLAEQDGVADLPTWARHVAAWAEGTPLATLDEERERHYYCWLYFAFLPGLEAAGLLDVSGERVRATPDEHDLATYRSHLG